jgi:hypothetical protein
MKFTRSYSRTYGNNVWTADGGEYRIVRNGSSYWGYTGYAWSYQGEQIGTEETLAKAKAAALAHAKTDRSILTSS